MFQYEVTGKMHQNLASKINVISCEVKWTSDCF